MKNAMEHGVHLIGSAHLDPVWLWTYQEGYGEIKATFQSALDRMDEFDQFIFTCSSAAFYEYIEQSEPELFQQVKEKISQGRWAPVGGWWVEADCNLPSGESFARQALYSQRYFQKKFGEQCRVAFAVDSFGHNGMLPQLIRQSGMEGFVFMRPEAYENDTIPKNLFLWESPDGTQLPTFRIAHGYNARSEEILDKIEKVSAMAQEQETDFLLFYGVGNHGGGPTIETLRRIEKAMEQGDHNIKHSSPDIFFSEVKEKYQELPVMTGDLRHHAPGCYSAHSKIKKDNRKAETMLTTAETVSALSHILRDTPYPKEAFEEAWKKVLFNQFHDVLGGCSIQEAYEDAKHSYGYALHTASSMLTLAAQRISWNIDTMGEETQGVDKEQDWQLWYPKEKGAPFVVFNPLSFERKFPVVVNAFLKKVVDDTGKEYLTQTVRGSRTDRNKKWDTLFVPTIPAYGYKLFWLFQQENEKLPEVSYPLQAVSSEPVWLENSKVRYGFDPETGALISAFLKEEQQELLTQENAGVLVIDESESDTWGHKRVYYDNIVGQFENATFRWLEDGPIRKKLRVESRYNNSILVQDYSLLEESEELKVQARLLFTEQHKMLKISFDFRGESPRIVHSMQFGHIEKSCTGEEQAALAWVTLLGQTTAQKEGGFSLVSDSKYAFSAPGSSLRMTIARGAIYADHFGDRDESCEFMDQGEQHFAYELIPHPETPAFSAIEKSALALNAPAVQVLETYHKGTLASECTGIEISEENIIASVFKGAENGAGYLLRVYEMDGKNTKARISLPILGRSFHIEMRGYEIKNYYIPREIDIPVSETNFIEDTV